MSKEFKINKKITLLVGGILLAIILILSTIIGYGSTDTYIGSDKTYASGSITITVNKQNGPTTSVTQLGKATLTFSRGSAPSWANARDKSLAWTTKLSGITGSAGFSLGSSSYSTSKKLSRSDAYIGGAKTWSLDDYRYIMPYLAYTIPKGYRYIGGSWGGLNGTNPDSKSDLLFTTFIPNSAGGAGKASNTSTHTYLASNTGSLGLNTHKRHRYTGASHTINLRPNQTTIAYDKNATDATGSTGSTTVYYDYTNTLAQNGFSRNGYSFAGWKYGSTVYGGTAGNTANNSIKTLWPSATSATVYAQWNLVNYTYKFSNPGTGAGSGTYNITTNTFTFYPGTKTGYTPSPASYTITKGSTGNKTITNTWTANKYTVTFNKNNSDPDSTEGTSSVTATYDSAMPAITKPTRTGYTFQGYYDTNAATGGTQYYTASGASARTWNKAGNTTLYARWTANSGEIQFDPNGGEGYMEPQSYTYNSTNTLNKCDFENDDYKFEGWNTKRDGSGTSYPDQATIKTAFTSGNAKLYAQWEDLHGKIIYNGNGATEGEMDDQEITKYEDVKLNNNEFFKAGKVFKEWNTKADGSGTSFPDGCTTQFTKEIVDQDGIINLYAQWSDGHFSLSGEAKAEGYKFEKVYPENGQITYNTKLFHNKIFSIFGIDENAEYIVKELAEKLYIPSYYMSEGEGSVASSDQKKTGRRNEALATSSENNTNKLTENVTYEYENTLNRTSDGQTLTFEKKVSGNDVTQTDKERAFTFSYYISGLDSELEYPYEKNAQDTGGEENAGETAKVLIPDSEGVISGEVQLKDGESFSISGIPENAKYNITEETGVNDVNAWEYRSKYTVTNGKDTVNSKTSRKLKLLGSNEYGLSINPDGESVNGINVETMGEESVSYLFRNTKSVPHNITIKKQINIDDEQNIDSDEEFDVKVDFANLDSNTAYTSSDPKYNFTSDDEGNAELDLKIKAKESITFNNIPGDSEYEITEGGSGYIPDVKVFNNDDVLLYETSGMYKQGVSVNNEVSANDEQELGLRSDQTVLFTNSKRLHNSLTVAKEVTGNGAKSTDEFDYEIHFTGLETKNHNVVKETVTFNEDGEEQVSSQNSTFSPQSSEAVYSFKLKDNQRIIINDISVDATYKITEKGSDKYTPSFALNDGFAEKVSGESEENTDLSTGTETLPIDTSFIFTNVKENPLPFKRVTDHDNVTLTGTGSEINVIEDTVPDRESPWEYTITQEVFPGKDEIIFEDILPDNLVFVSGTEINIKWIDGNDNEISSPLHKTWGPSENVTGDYENDKFEVTISGNEIMANSKDPSMIKPGGKFIITMPVKVDPEAEMKDFLKAGQVYKLNERLIFKNSAKTILRKVVDPDEEEYEDDDYTTNTVITNVPLKAFSKLSVKKNVDGELGDKTREFGFKLALSGLKPNKNYSYGKQYYVCVNTEYSDENIVTVTAKNESGEPVSNVQIIMKEIIESDNEDDESTNADEIIGSTVVNKKTGRDGKAVFKLDGGSYLYEIKYDGETISGNVNAVPAVTDGADQIISDGSIEQMNELYIERVNSKDDSSFTTDSKGNAEIFFDLKDGQNKIFENLPTGVKYQIVEVSSNHVPSFAVTTGAENVETPTRTLQDSGEDLSTDKETLKDSTGFTFTNTKNPINKKIKITKKWTKDITSLRPDNITVNLIKVPKNQTGEAYAVFDSTEHTLTFFTDTAGKYLNGQTIGTKTYYSGIKNTNNEQPWSDVKANVRKVRFDSNIKPDTVSNWFNGMTNLQDVKGLDRLITKDITSYAGLFKNCKNLETIDLSNLDTSNANNFSMMFEGCESLTDLDLSNFDTSKVTSVSNMFNGCSELKHIKVSDRWSMGNVTSSDSMFAGAIKLPNFVSLITDKTYAHFNEHGYLEYKEYKVPGIVAQSGDWTKDGNTWQYQFSVTEEDDDFKYYVYENHIKGYIPNSSENELIRVNEDSATLINERIPAHPVIVTKNVKGNLGDLTKEFEFTAHFTGLQKNTNYGQFTSDGNGNATYTFKLKSKGSIEFEEIPDASEMSITEAASNHFASVVVKTLNPETIILTKENQEKEKALSTGNIEILDDTKIDFKNTRELEPRTSGTGMPVKLLLAALVALILIFAKTRKKKATDLENLF